MSGLRPARMDPANVGHRFGASRPGPVLKGIALSAALLSLTASAIAAPAQEFGFRAAGTGAAAPAVVTGHGIDLFAFSTAAGGLQPIQRAEVVSARLESLAQHHQLQPDSFTLRRQNGQIVIADNVLGAEPQVLLTVLPGAAARVPGANGDAARLAAWWLAVLRDQINLSLGQPPVATVGTEPGDAFQKVYQRLGSPTAPVSDDAIRQAIGGLEPSLRKALTTAIYSVPLGFRFDPALVLDSSPAPAAASSTTTGAAAGTAASPVAADNATQAPARLVSANPPLATPSNGAGAGTTPATPNPPADNPPAANPPADNPVAGARTPGPVNGAAPQEAPGPSAVPGAGPAGADPNAPRAPAYQYSVQMITDPTPLVVGQSGLITLKIGRMKPGDKDTAAVPVTGAVAVIRIKSQTAAGDAPWALARAPERGAGEYGFHAVFHAAGVYFISVTIVPTIGDPFTAVLSAQVAPAPK